MFQVYVSKPSEYPHVPAKLLLLLTGGTGLKSVNNQIQADTFASEGFLVVMPDLFGGDPAPNTSATVEAGAELDSAAGGSSYPVAAAYCCFHSRVILCEHSRSMSRRMMDVFVSWTRDTGSQWLNICEGWG